MAADLMRDLPLSQRGAVPLQCMETTIDVCEALGLCFERNWSSLGRMTVNHDRPQVHCRESSERRS